VKPIRVQLSRRKGFRLPDNAVVVSRPSKWGNPYRIHGDVQLSPAGAVRLFRVTRTAEQITEIRAELRGKNLACWCPLDQPCHADVLLEIANSKGTWRR